MTILRKDGSYVKTQRLQEIKKKIATQFPNPVNLELLKLWVEVNIGLKPETAEDYIQKVVAAQNWVIVNGSILAEVPETKA